MDSHTFPANFLRFWYHITCLMPDLQNSKPGAPREATAVKNVLKVKQIIFIKPDSSNLDIVTDFVIHGYKVLYSHNHYLVKNKDNSDRN